MTELETCPFCGGVAIVIREANHQRCFVGCNKTNCLGFIGLGRVYETRQGAIEAWNTRHERTCRNVSKHNNPKPGTFNVGGHFECSGCGFMYWFSEIPYDYCPGCGAKMEMNNG